MAPQNCETTPFFIYFGRWKSIKLMQTLNVIFCAREKEREAKGSMNNRGETSSVMKDTFAPTAQVSRRDPDIISHMRT